MENDVKIEIDEKNKMMILTTIGEISVKNNKLLIPKLILLKLKHGIKRVLLDHRKSKSKDNPTDQIKFFEKLEKLGIAKKISFANVTNMDDDERNSVEAIASNRGFNIHNFTDLHKAKQWLIKQWIRY